jgi:hypothetical protein
MAGNAAVGLEAHLAGGGEPIAQALPRAQQPRLGSGQAQPMRFGKVPLGLPLQIAGANDGLVFNGQFNQSACQTVGQRIDRGDGFLQGRSSLGRSLWQLLGGVRRSCPIDQRVARDLEQLRAGVVEGAEALTVADGLDEDILQHVGGNIGIGQAVSQVGQQFAFMGPPGR